MSQIRYSVREVFANREPDRRQAALQALVSRYGQEQQVRPDHQQENTP